MQGKKSTPVWVPPNIGRAGKALRGAMLLGAALWALAAPVAGQPLQAGVSSRDGRHFLLDDGKVRIFSKDFREESRLDSDPITALYQGARGWDSSFLALTEKEFLRLSVAGKDIGRTVVMAGEVTVVPWGDDFLAHTPKASEVVLLTPGGESKLPVANGALESLEVIDPTMAFIKGSQGWATLVRDATGNVTLRKPVLPFPAEQAQAAYGGGSLYFWSPRSETVLAFANGGDTGGKPLTLPEMPVHGLRVLENGELVAAGADSLYLVSVSGGVVRLGSPATGVDDKSFAEWPIIAVGDGLSLLISDKAQTRIMHLPKDKAASSELLPAGKLVATVSPEPGKTGATLLFWETSFEEPKLDDDGRQILDLATGKAASPLTVSGYVVIALDTEGGWKTVTREPRAHLVGPIERVGDRVIYATQTEPEHKAGIELEINHRYPYPAVLVQGRSFSDPDDVWSFQQPRGDSPSKDRLPEGKWPVLTPTGPLLLTSEAGSLLAIDPVSGKLQWASDELPIDDSTPLMLSWPDAFALQATESTGRSLLRIDPLKGTLLEEHTLNDLFSFQEKWRHLLGVLLVCGSLGYYIYAAGRRSLYIRKIAGLQALDEAVGRATEMGKPVLYVVGLADVDDIQTMASLSILSHVARKTAEYDTPIVTTTARAVAFSAAQEIVRDAFSVAGRPDAFSVESVRYISDDQFGYTAGVDGIMVREKPAANFYIGNFYAESLILAETGYATGSIQIAGTAQPSQVPFFVAACDYTLIGEELYAASAYLSRDPLQVGSLRGQDVGKAIVMILLVLCSLLYSAGIDLAKVSEFLGVTLQ